MSTKNKLKHFLLQLLKHDNHVAFATRFDRKRLCLLFLSDLHTLGYKIADIKSLKSKYITAVVKYWQNQNLSNATIKNRMSAVRYSVGNDITMWSEKLEIVRQIPVTTGSPSSSILVLISLPAFKEEKISIIFLIISNFLSSTLSCVPSISMNNGFYD